MHYDLVPGRCEKYCYELCHVCLYVCLCVFLYVCPLAYLKNHMSKLHEMFCTCYLCPWLSPLILYGFVDDVMYAHNWPGKDNVGMVYTQK